MDCAGNMDDRLLSLLERARAYCASSEQCSSAVRHKLRDWGGEATDADTVIARLKEEGYIDDARYARAYCESKMLRSGWGRMKVVYQLRQKHLPREAIEAGMEAVDEEVYMSVLKEAAAKKVATIRDTDPAVRRRKLVSFLAQRGYIIDEINEIIKTIKFQP